MSLSPYLVSRAEGLVIGAIYGPIAVRLPTPPIIACLGLVRMLVSEPAVQWLRGHQDVVSKHLRKKPFAIRGTAEKTKSKTLLPFATWNKEYIDVQT